MFTWIAEHWEFVAGLGVFAMAVAAYVIYIRATGKSTVHKTQTENIDALQGLLNTRTAERDESKRQCDAERQAKEATEGELAALRSEFKILGAVILDELLSYWSRRTEIMAELAATKADLQIANMTIERLQTKRAGDGG